MPPPKQSLRADDGMVCKPYLGLEIELKLMFGESASQLKIERASRLSLGTKDGKEKPICSAPFGFCLVERKVGVGNQFVNGRAVIWSYGYAGAAAKVEVVPVVCATIPLR
jgi:hypothetical protein